MIAQELGKVKTRKEITRTLKSYQSRRLVRSAAVQGLSRFASDIIIRGFDTPAKIVWDEGKGLPRIENCNYAGVVTRMLQPILPIFFMMQFNFLYDGYKNEVSIDLKNALAIAAIGGLILFFLSAGVVGEASIAASIGLKAFVGTEGILDFEAISTAIREMSPFY